MKNNTNNSHLPKKPSNKIGRRRWNLWVNDPHCYYCGEKIRWRHSTVDHVYSKVRNGKRNAPKGKGETVLACKDCNQGRQIAEMKAMPRWRWWLRSKAFPNLTRKDLTLFEKVIIIWYVKIRNIENERVIE